MTEWLVLSFKIGERPHFPFPEKFEYINSNCLGKPPGPQELLMLVLTFSTSLTGDMIQPRCNSAKNLLEDGVSITKYLTIFCQLLVFVVDRITDHCPVSPFLTLYALMIKALTAWLS